MSVQTVLLDFSVEAGRAEDEPGQKALLSGVEPLLRKHLPGLSAAARVQMPHAGGALLLLLADRGASVSVRVFPQGLITVNIEYYKADGDKPLLDFESARALEAVLRKQLNCSKGQAYPPIKRTLFGRYFPSADERLLEYDIDSVIHESTSPFQKIQIVHSKSLGNMLVLDELQNIAEADLIYTETLMQRGKENFEGAEIIILGGGDGALLYELLKEKPKFVWMLEIDEDVMTACNKYMKSICGDVLERRKCDEYEIVVDDCMVTLNKFLSQGKKVDYVFGDLTDVPISDTPSGEIWDFIMLILETSFKVLKPSGKFMTHANGASCPEALKMYEQQLMKLDPPVEFVKSSAFIPSFLEDWIFYQISFKTEKNGTA
ncbi:spermine synthase isoform X2 [Arctopsyche grandis]|uniref:spermine synthase isoform X2 n=1 Tax=Arctopsyche grandis TaxID=121162 RepID=UPI00406D6E47